MFGFLKRLFGIGTTKEQSNAVPVEITKQKLSALQKELDENVKSLADTKIIAIRSAREAISHQAKMAELDKNALSFLERGVMGELPADEAERLAIEALTQRKAESNLQKTAVKNKQKYDVLVAEMETKIWQIKSEIIKLESEYKMVKDYPKGYTIDKDSIGTLDMLEKLKARIDEVDEDEAPKETDKEVADNEKSIEFKISPQVQTLLDELKCKMGIPVPPRGNNEAIITIETDTKDKKD